MATNDQRYDMSGLDLTGPQRMNIKFQDPINLPVSRNVRFIMELPAGDWKIGLIEKVEGKPRQLIAICEGQVPRMATIDD